MDFEKLKPEHFDALREIANIGMGHAATALSQMIGCRVHLQVPRASVVPLADVPDLIGGAELLVVGVYLQIYGDAPGNLLLIFPRQSASNLLNLIMPDKKISRDGLLTEDHTGAIREVGNILASSYLTAMSSLLGITMIPSVPSVAFDMAGSLVDYTLTQLGEEVDSTLLIETEFLGEQEVQGHFYMLPTPKSLKILLKAGNVDL